MARDRRILHNKHGQCTNSSNTTFHDFTDGPFPLDALQCQVAKTIALPLTSDASKTAGISDFLAIDATEMHSGFSTEKTTDIRNHLTGGA